MSNRIDEFADKFQGWLAEWAEKRQAAQVSVKANQRPFLLTKEGNNHALGSQAQQSGILKPATEHTYPGDPGPEPIPEPSADDGYEDEPYWSDSQTAAEMWRDKGAK